MSHLPLDARAILDYLNELGYRNISAQQLKEFMKGMQPQSEFNKSKLKAKSSSNHQQQQQAHQLPSSTRTTSATAAGTTESQPQSAQRRAIVKVIKCKKPLCHFKFYLDICDHLLAKRIEEQIKALGGALEFFLTSNVTHFVTDKSVLPPTVNNNSLSSRPGTPQTPGTPNTPQTPYSFESNEGKNNGNNTPIGTKKTRQTRADAILNRARRPSTTTVAAISNVNANAATSAEQASFIKQKTASSQAYVVWQTEYALHFFKKVQHELREYLTRDRRVTVKGCTVEPISLKGGFIKIEAIKRNYRPYYQLFRKSSGTEWPKIELTQDDGAFRLSPRKKSPIRNVDQVTVVQEKQKMTRKSRSRSSQNQRAIPTGAQALKKPEVAVKTGGTAQRNSNVGGTGCKQPAKESSDKQCGVCEICKIEYDTLTIHLKTKDHEYFAKNSQNFIALDTLIHTSADVNKFLNEDKKIELKSELEEMEVENHLIVDVNEPDPLEGSEPIVVQQEEKRRCSGAHMTPSPTIREKSKRSTKGKHSSEKFQHNAAPHSKSVKTPLKLSSSSQKKTSSSTLELNRIESAAISAKTTTKTTPNTSSTRRKQNATTVVSPPIRAMLPPSSLYKVETPDIYTPARKTREAGEEAVASPSLIVKFKKVRTTELHRLNGEAESFMFPKIRTSSELPTDIDRQTTSDNVRVSVSSGSLDSTSELMDVDIEKNGSSSKATIPIEKRAIAIAKRRKGQIVAPKQSFPSAPIQPEVQLNQRKSSTAIATATELTTTTIAKLSAAASATITAATSNITLPEATRKSSRTATAIVTAATTSSRLLRAAVEAAKNNRRKGAKESVNLLTNRRNCQSATPESRSESKMASNSVELQNRVPVGNLEDRMGEEKANKEKDNDSQKSDVAIDDSDDEQDYEYDDYENDKDYVHYKKRNLDVGCNFAFNGKYTSTRKQRAIQRDLRKMETCVTATCEENNPNDDLHNLSSPKTATKANNNSQCSVLLKNKLTPRFFDYSSSVLLNKLRYAFERLPAGDLWYRVFSRQDACEENYFEYYGSTDYRKLPYELGPIPFKRTLDGINCKLCSVSNAKTKSESERRNFRIKQELGEDSSMKQRESSTNSKLYNSTACASGSSAALFGAQPSSSLKYTHKHKKLHLLQRYRQEQQELMQKQQAQDEQKGSTLSESGVSRALLKCDSKASTPDREHYRERERERAGSIHSNTSSCASSTATISKLKYRNKHLSKAAFLNMELPPRKSPREHASTLALVSCIIKQRQDSQSKPNSETDEPPVTPTATAEAREEYRELNATAKEPTPLPTTTNTDMPAARSPRNTRSAVVTPVEELCFTTEISENVKRMRRGQNKYDHSPPIVLPTSRAARGRQPKSPIGRRSYLQKHQSQTPNLVKRRKRQNTAFSSTPAKHHSYSGLLAQGSAMPSIRKTGSKKGVLEFEVDSTALKALDAATKYTGARQLEWEIDKYLQLAGREYDVDMDSILGSKDAITLGAGPTTGVKSRNIASTSNSARKTAISTLKSADLKSTAFESNTPPPTDCFSSDFDLCDLFTNTPPGNCSDDEHVDGVRKGFSLYNSMALHNYFRRRKNLKSNRTGWPKVQKKKSSVRQQQMSEQKIRFLRDIVQIHQNGINEVNANEGDGESSARRKRENGVITPPDSETGGNENGKMVANEDEDADDTDVDAVDSIPEEDDAETMADSIEEDREVDADAEADEEDDGDGECDGECDGDDGTAGEEDAEDNTFESTKKRTRQSIVASPVGKIGNSLTPNTTTGATSTPSAQMLRGLRRTPQLNGSLGSCVSPSEKAGDNSDIFTVSSDGLDTDLDMSNSHSQPKGDDEPHNHQHQDQCPNYTPKRKFDLSKYAPKSGATNSCAAEAATAAVKSLAISQFLKKEVRVNCRRIRAPFRRFRYRR